MVQTTTKKLNQEVYQCEECGMQYEEKEWAEKCEAWCKEHHSCNLEITSHTVQEMDTISENQTDGKLPSAEDIKFRTRFFYALIAISASLAFFLALYWVLRLDTSIGTFMGMFKNSTPLYFWPYVIMTLGAIVLFGVNITLFVYRWRKFGPPRIKGQAGTGLGSVVGIGASACPICGSTILAAIGIAGGLATFPLQGLELKALSLGLLVLPIWLIRKDLKKLESDCTSGVCPMPQDHSFKEKDRPWLFGLLALTAILAYVAWGMLKTDPVMAQFLASKNPGAVSLNNQSQNTNVAIANNPIFDAVVAKVIPEKGFQSKIVLNDTILKLVENGVIDRAKFEALYKQNYGSLLPEEIKTIFNESQRKPILLTQGNANIYVNLLWPIGLANYMTENKKSPMINGNDVFGFASTGGWNLGKEENGGAYFNKFKIVELTPEQETLITKIAENSYRPCCNNSTFFQDCNHGSALLGLLQLGASQGLSENELWREALAFNSFWFSQQYIYNGLYFKVVKGIDWDKVDPKVVMGKDFSSGSGSGNIQAEVAKIPNLIPQQKGQGGSGCGT